MPIVRVWCLPPVNENDLIVLCDAIVKTIESTPELGLEGKNAVTVLFPPDLMKFGIGEEIIIEVVGLFNKPERSPMVRQNLARKLGRKIMEMFPNARVECFVKPFDPANGFWSSSDPKWCAICGGKLNEEKIFYMNAGCSCSGISMEAVPCEICGQMHWKNTGDPIQNAFFDSDKNKVIKKGA